jgi:hypothetical protein
VARPELFSVDFLPEQKSFRHVADGLPRTLDCWRDQAGTLAPFGTWRIQLMAATHRLSDDLSQR